MHSALEEEEEEEEEEAEGGGGDVEGGGGRERGRDGYPQPQPHQQPFRVTVERQAAYSRTEYALEHVASPGRLARLTRDGTGAGWLEVDTGVAARAAAGAVYVVDVAVAALLLVAHADEGFAAGVELFEPPPVALLSGDRRASRGSLVSDGGRSGSGSASWAGSRASRREEAKKRKKKMMMMMKKNNDGGESGGSGRRRMEQFEIDLESQSSDLGKGDKDKIPGAARALIGLVTITFKCLVWCAAVGIKALVAMLSGLSRCCGLGKL